MKKSARTSNYILGARLSTDEEEASKERIIRRVSLVGVLGNVALTAFKLFAGITAGSSAMISDAAHSMSDIFATGVAFFGVQISRREADRSHPYGHERMECAASLVLGAILLLTGLGIGLNGIGALLSGADGELAVPGRLALAAAVISIAVKEAMFRYTRRCAVILDSDAFMADAWHHRSDALSSVGSLIGIGAARAGYPIFDPLAGIVICLCIVKVSYDISKDALNKMLDTSRGEEYEKAVSNYIASRSDVLHLDLLRTRIFGNKVYIDCEILVDGNQTLREAHAIAEQVHDGVEQAFPDIKHIMIHVNPSDGTDPAAQNTE